MVFENKALSEQELQNYYYHWFWGICFGKHSTTPSIGEELFNIRENGLLDTIKTRIEKINNYHPITRFIFWLFNIDNYTYSSYILSANDSYERYLNDREQETKYPEQNYLDNEETKSSEQKSPDLEFFNEDDHFCMVTDYMLEHLQFLNIKKEVGEVITYGEVHSAYRRAARRCHPDKTGSREAWNKLEEHHNILKSMIVPSEMDNIQFRKFYADLNEIRISIDELEESIQKLEKRVANLDAKMNDLWKKLDRFEGLSDPERSDFIPTPSTLSSKSNLLMIESSEKGKEYPMYRMFTNNRIHNPIVNHQNQQQDSNDSQALVIYGMHNY